MPKYSRQDIIEKYGVQHAYISVYIKREKLIEEAGGDFDTKNPINKIWFKKQDEKLKLDSTEVNHKTDSKKKKEKQKEIDFTGREEENAAKLRKHEADIEQKTITTELRQEELDLKRMQRMRLQGQLIPTELVQRTFVIHMKNIADTIYSGSDDIATKMVKILGGDRDNLIQIRKEIIEIMNSCISEAKTRSKRDINNIMSEYDTQIKNR
jgi:hypothetical protein